MYRSRAVAGNGDITGDSGQGYVRPGWCVIMSKRRNPDAELVIVDKD